MKIFTSDENRPPSANKSDQKKGKSDATVNRSVSLNSRRQSNGIIIFFL